MVRNLRHSAVLQWRLLHAGFVCIMLGTYQCFCRDLTFLLLAQISKVHECCIASDLNLILWMVTSVSLVSSGISYSARAWGSWCCTVIPHHFLHSAHRLCGEPTLLLCFLVITLWLVCCSASYLGFKTSFSESFRNIYHSVSTGSFLLTSEEFKAFKSVYFISHWECKWVVRTSYAF